MVCLMSIEPRVIPAYILLLFFFGICAGGAIAAEVERDHLVMHCLPGGEGFYVNWDGSHGPSEGVETDIVLEYSLPDGSISMLDVAETPVFKGGTVTTVTGTLKDFDSVSVRLKKGDISYEVPYILFEHGYQRYIIYKFEESSPVLVVGLTGPMFSNLIHQRCYVRSRYKVRN